MHGRARSLPLGFRRFRATTRKAFSWPGRSRVIPITILVALLLSALACRAFAGLVSARSGDHLIVGTNGNDVIIGTPGDDTIYGLGGDDTILAGGGSDDIDGGAGADDIHGGPGIDAVLYGGRTLPVTVTLDNVPNDGEPGEGDNVHTDVEQIYGGSSGDRLTGDLAPNASPELIDGGAGDDHIVGGSGPNRLYGGPGNDYINNFNGKPDAVDCGAGSDTVLADAFDLVIDCEHRVPPPRITSSIGYVWRYFGSPTMTTFSALTVDHIPRGADVRVDCRGRGCPFASKRPTVPVGHRRLVLSGLLRGAKLLAGAQLEIRITKPDIVLQNAIGKLEVLTMQQGGPPSCSVRLLAPGAPVPRHEGPCQI